MTADVVKQAQDHLDAERYREAREAALGALEGATGDVALLRIAGRAGVEIGSDDAVDLLKKVTELAPDDAQSWRDLGDALATEGRTEESNEAFERLRGLVDLPEHEVCVLHGIVGLELRRDNPDDALARARDAAGIDPHGRTRQLIAFLAPEEAEEGAPPPSRDDVDNAITASLLELRRYHVEDRGASRGGGLG